MFALSEFLWFILPPKARTTQLFMWWLKIGFTSYAKWTKHWIEIFKAFKIYSNITFCLELGASDCSSFMKRAALSCMIDLKFGHACRKTRNVSSCWQSSHKHHGIFDFSYNWDHQSPFAVILILEVSNPRSHSAGIKPDWEGLHRKPLALRDKFSLQSQWWRWNRSVSGVSCSKFSSYSVGIRFWTFVCPTSPLCPHNFVTRWYNSLWNLSNSQLFLHSLAHRHQSFALEILPQS